jgi:hypothetical protein
VGVVEKLTRKFLRSKQNEQKEEKLHTVRPAGSKIRRGVSYTITTENRGVFDWAVALCAMQNALLVISNLT